jgi:hypothetical protein
MGASTKAGELLGAFGFAGQSLLQVSQAVTQETGAPRWKVAADIVYCGLRWGATPGDYLFLRFFELSERERRTYVVSRMSKNMIAQFNKAQWIRYFQDKTLFAERFGNLFGRSWADVSSIDPDTFAKFAVGKRIIIYKPSNSKQGMGAQKLNVGEYADLTTLYWYLKGLNGGRGIIEDWIVQHDALSAVYSRAVNPIRVITVLKGQDCNILHATLTIGNGRDVVNASLGDMVAPIELSTGMIAFPAQDKTGRVYYEHPLTGHAIHVRAQRS